MQRNKIIEELLQSMHAMRHKLMVGYTTKKEMVITPSQGFVLRLIAHSDSTNVKAIAKVLNITSSAATQLVDGLAEKGYLIRKEDSSDRRVISLSLSEKAKRLFKEFKEQGLKKMTELFSALSDIELAQYALLNKKISESIADKKGE
jgi:DNA-binding MarR family transcriptional regulator